MIIFILLIKPYSIKILNYLELANELILLLSCYFMMTFTTWITDVEFQYKIGDVFIKLLSAVFILNSIMIFIEIGSVDGFSMVLDIVSEVRKDETLAYLSAPTTG